MKNLLLSDQVFIFVCYKAGTGGESLSTHISKLEPCVPLEHYITAQHRTIITSDIFEKVFLLLFRGRIKSIQSNPEK